MKRFLLITFSYSLLSTAVSAELLNQKPLATFIKTYCYDCHGDGSDKGGLDFDNLSSDLSDQETLTKWIDIFDRTVSGDMPPKKKKKRPGYEDMQIFYKELSPALLQAHNSQKGTVLRRLNRQEYQNTLNDIFGTNLKIAEMLPEDGRSHEFTNVGSALGISMEQIQTYLKITDQVLDNAIVKTIAKPKSTIRKGSYLNDRKAPEFIGSSWKKLADNSIVRFAPFGYPSGMVRGTGVRQSGYYKIRIHGYAHQSKSPISFHVGGISFTAGAEKPIYGFYSLPPDKISTVEFTTYIKENDMVTIEPYGINDPYRYRRKKENMHINDFKGPGLAIKEVEVEGPLIEEFPTRGHKLLFSKLNRQEVMPHNANNRFKPWYKPTFKIDSFNEDLDSKAALTDIAQKAFRRDKVDVSDYVNLFKSERNKGYSFEEALRTATAALFCSPDFLYLKENPGKLNDYQIASRLSYFLNRTLPDKELMTAAEEGKLQTKKERNAQMRRLMRHPHFQRFLVDFTDAWLNLREMDFTAPDKELFPEFDVYLRHSMPLETRAFLRELIDSNLSVSNLIKSDFSMINERLAQHYGIPHVKGAAIRKVKLPSQSLRGGFLSQGAVLKVSANGTNTSPIVRGVWVLERIMGMTPPPPPEGIPGVEPDIRGAETLRDILEKHRNVSSCQSCHKKIDPMGFALEVFNPIGGERSFYRSLAKSAPRINLRVNGSSVRYRQGPSVDASGEFTDGHHFKNYQEYRDILATQKEKIAKALTKKFLTFATGREMGFSDRHEIDRIVKTASLYDYRVKDLLTLTINSKIFLNK